jgi:hypothetical protein
MLVCGFVVLAPKTTVSGSFSLDLCQENYDVLAVTYCSVILWMLYKLMQIHHTNICSFRTLIPSSLSPAEVHGVKDRP